MRTDSTRFVASSTALAPLMVLSVARLPERVWEQRQDRRKMRFALAALFLVIYPFLLPAAWTQFLIGVPAYIVTEVTLSFLGLGASEPTPTWGGMLVPLQQYVVLTSYPWMFAPAVAVVAVCLALQVVAPSAASPAEQTTKQS